MSLGAGDAGGPLSPQGEVDGGVGDQEEDDRQDAGPQGPGPVDVVENVVSVQSEGSHFEVPDLPGDVGGVRHVDIDQFQLEELWNVERDGEDDGGQDEDRGVPPAGEPQPGVPVPDWSDHSQQALQGDTHQQVALARHQDVLQRVQKVGEHHHVHIGLDDHGVVADDEDEEHNLEDGQSDEALVEG